MSKILTNEEIEKLPLGTELECVETSGALFTLGKNYKILKDGFIEDNISSLIIFHLNSRFKLSETEVWIPSNKNTSKNHIIEIHNLIKFDKTNDKITLSKKEFSQKGFLELIEYYEKLKNI